MKTNLTTADVLKIRELASTGTLTQAVIARRFGISASLLKKIIHHGWQPEQTFAVKCFVNGIRKQTDKLTSAEAAALRGAARHLQEYLTREYQLEA